MNGAGFSPTQACADRLPGVSFLRLGCLVALVVVLPGASVSSEPTPPDAVLSEILTHALQCDGGFRVGKVMWTRPDRTHKGGGCDCTEPRETFFPRDSPIVIVSTWKLAGREMQSATRALFSVEFQVLATTEGEGDKRNILPLTKPSGERVTYQLRLKNGQWFLVDPPLPRVGLAGIIKDLQLTIRSLLPKEQRPRSQEEMYASAQAQLNILEQLLQREKAQSTGH
jgi:hypothetical protein